MMHPLHELLHRHVGIDSFALDGDETEPSDVWQDRPGRAHSRRFARAP